MQDVLDLVEEEYKSESESSSEYEEYTDSEDETGPRLKPVFVPRTDRVTIKEKEELAKEEEAVEVQKKRQVDLRKKESLKVSSGFCPVKYVSVVDGAQVVTRRQGEPSRGPTPGPNPSPSRGPSPTPGPS